MPGPQQSGTNAKPASCAPLRMTTVAPGWKTPAMASLSKCLKKDIKEGAMGGGQSYMPQVLDGFKCQYKRWIRTELNVTALSFVQTTAILLVVLTLSPPSMRAV